MRGREICFSIVVVLIALVLLQPPRQQPRFTLLRGVVRAIKLVLFAEEPPAPSPAPWQGGYQHCPPVEAGAEPPKEEANEDYAAENHGVGW